MTDEWYREILDWNLPRGWVWVMIGFWTMTNRAAIVANWLNRNELERLYCPSFSPYLNSCEMKSNGGLRKSNVKVKTSWNDASLGDLIRRPDRLGSDRILCEFPSSRWIPVGIWSTIRHRIPSVGFSIGFDWVLLSESDRQLSSYRAPP